LVLLEEAAARIECDSASALLAALQAETGALDAARRSLARCEELMPLADAGNRAWLCTRRAELAWRSGDPELAERLYREAKTPWGARLAERIAASAGAPQARRVLEVPFVQQFHTTCAPATLAALARSFGRP